MYINFPLMFLLPADGGRNWIAADCCPLLWPVEIWQLRKNLEECQVAEHERVGGTHCLGHFMAESIWQEKSCSLYISPANRSQHQPCPHPHLCLICPIMDVFTKICSSHFPLPPWTLIKYPDNEIDHPREFPCLVEKLGTGSRDQAHDMSCLSYFWFLWACPVLRSVWPGIFTWSLWMILQRCLTPGTRSTVSGQGTALLFFFFFSFFHQERVYSFHKILEGA